MIVLIVLGLIVSIVGFLGCILPVLPGPPLSFLALIMLSFAKDWQPFSSDFLWIMAGLTIGVTILDYIVPALGAKKFGASKWSVYASLAGMFIGIFFFPPWGMLIGALLGAVITELLTGKGSKLAIQAGIGVFVGNVVAVGLKLAVSGIMLFYYIKEMF